MLLRKVIDLLSLLLKVIIIGGSSLVLANHHTAFLGFREPQST
jgi:hypothetical protein